MSRLLVVLVAVLVLLIGALFLFEGLASERPRTAVEQAVSLENLS